MGKRASIGITAVEGAAIAAAAVLALALNGIADWDLALLATLTILSIVSDLVAIRTRVAGVLVSASLTAIVIGAVFLGPGPAMVIGVVTILAGWTVHRYPTADLLTNLVAYLWFPLAAGLSFHWIMEGAAIERGSIDFYLAIIGTFAVAIVVNFLIVGSYSSHINRSSFATEARRGLWPVLPSELAGAILAVGVSFAYVEVGIQAVVLVAVVILVFQYLVGALLQSQDRADELELRNRQLAGFQVALLSALVRTIDLRDRVTADHSAAVARYSREIAARAGLSPEDQEVVHTAGLLHDIGKFILPDSILKAGGRKLTDSEWAELEKHPHEGARIVSQVDGYQPVSEIILAHHERFDGRGYPRGLRGDEIPVLARVVSVANVYAAMMAQDARRESVGWREAASRLRQVAGTELDPRFVEIFVDILESNGRAFRHAEDVDFETELALDERIRRIVQATPAPPELARFKS
jgi:putative nucleotidyltransferase with HDIG domain